MGCCMSADKPPQSPKFHSLSSKPSRAPPPVDEEAVKEVLSETSNAKIFLKIRDEPTKVTPRKSVGKIKQQNDNSNLEETNLFEISTTKYQEDGEVYRRRVTERSPAKARNFQPVGNSPVRGKEQSPGRVRSVSGRDIRGAGFGSSSRRTSGAGDGSAPRSRSPVTRAAAGGGGKNGMGRSQSARRTERSPRRVGSDLHERVRRPELSSGINNDESLENPLVSLECFIFL